MGLFNRTRPTNQRDTYSLVSRAGLNFRPTSKDRKHHASWSSNGVTFYVNSSGVAWRHDKEPNTNIDDDGMTNAALAQLEEAYRFPISFPGVEENILSVWRVAAEISNQEVPKGARLSFNWSPPLPRTN